MANIGIDAKRAFRNFSGLGNYSRALISGLSRFYPDHTYTLYTPDYEEKGKQFDFSRESNIRVCKPHGIYSVLPSALWRSAGIVSDLKRDRIDLFHGLSGELPAGASGIPKIVTMHDVIFLRYPEYYKSFDRRIYEKKFGQACRDANIILAISRQTADDLIHFLGADPRKIEIVYQGCDPRFYDPVPEQKLREAKDKYSLPDRFILNVGTIEERKNLAGVVRALEHIPEEIRLVAVGRATPYLEQVRRAARETGTEHRIQFIHNADFSDFPAIYKQAAALTYVSVFEGFGIPVLEGLAAGVPVITSGCSSMPEAGGTGAIYVDPLRPGEIADAVNRLLGSPELAEACIARGLEHASLFKEDLVAKNVHDLYKTLLK